MDHPLLRSAFSSSLFTSKIAHPTSSTSLSPNFHPWAGDWQRTRYDSPISRFFGLILIRLLPSPPGYAVQSDADPDPLPKPRAPTRHPQRGIRTSLSKPVRINPHCPVTAPGWTQIVLVLQIPLDPTAQLDAIPPSDWSTDAWITYSCRSLASASSSLALSVHNSSAIPAPFLLPPPPQFKFKKARPGPTSETFRPGSPLEARPDRSRCWGS
ncbi:hypothetical protein N7462_001038 [Penicillium macrosclerotiorum]|uniref:uncharacterized protein n=1 Tax=Penicillium macrosclerotiorum TaxID=303699 RepID=UPI00254937B5|nr:uncharacterized protein N7462_001038 [Penicillium macrosclerotiorum]KAJ5699033.1 hypothetical protein N7462_001038 [Penicillium macrosclerotiorum]